MSTFSLKITYDHNPENPWEAWDTEPPLFWNGGRSYGNHSYKFENENPLDSILAHVSDHKLALNFKPLCVAMDIADMYYDKDIHTK